MLTASVGMRDITAWGNFSRLVIAYELDLVSGGTYTTICILPMSLFRATLQVLKVTGELIRVMTFMRSSGS